MEKYEFISLIGKGNFGSISKIRRLSDNKILVWKELNYGNMDEKDKHHIVSEVNILRELHHPNIVKYYDRIIDKKQTKIYIVMEYCQGGDLSQLIRRCRHNKEYISEEIIWKIFTQVVLALHCCHSHKNGKILHRDIKPSNIFLDKDNNIKLGDFGLSRILSNESNFAYSNVGTPYYMSPEQIDEKCYNEKSDIWSLGCFLYEITNLHPPFEATNHLSLALKIKSGKIEKINGMYSKELERVILWMMNINQNKRPSVEDLINLPMVSLRIREKKIKDSWNRYKKYEESLKEKEEKLKLKENNLNLREELINNREKDLKEKEEKFFLEKKSFYESKNDNNNIHEKIYSNELSYEKYVNKNNNINENNNEFSYGSLLKNSNSKIYDSNINNNLSNYNLEYTTNSNNNVNSIINNSNINYDNSEDLPKNFYNEYLSIPQLTNKYNQNNNNVINNKKNNNEPNNNNNNDKIKFKRNNSFNKTYTNNNLDNDNNNSQNYSSSILKIKPKILIPSSNNNINHSLREIYKKPSLTSNHSTNLNTVTNLNSNNNSLQNNSQIHTMIYPQNLKQNHMSIYSSNNISLENKNINNRVNNVLYSNYLNSEFNNNSNNNNFKKHHNQTISAYSTNEINYNNSDKNIIKPKNKMTIDYSNINEDNNNNNNNTNFNMNNLNFNINNTNINMNFINNNNNNIDDNNNDSNNNELNIKKLKNNKSSLNINRNIYSNNKYRENRTPRQNNYLITRNNSINYYNNNNNVINYRLINTSYKKRSNYNYKTPNTSRKLENYL